MADKEQIEDIAKTKEELAGQESQKPASSKELPKELKTSEAQTTDKTAAEIGDKTVESAGRKKEAKQVEASTIKGINPESKPVPLKAVPGSPHKREQGETKSRTEYYGRGRDRDNRASPLEEAIDSAMEQSIEIPTDLKPPPKGEVFYATGRRKTSSARVFMQGGKGAVSINGSSVKEYFPYERVQNEALIPLRRLEAGDMFDLKISVKGGGIEGQAGAIRHGLARALLKYDESLKKYLRKSGYLTRDPRSVERKKVGLHKARKSPQYSKR